MNPLDLSRLHFAGGVVDASTFQPLQGPTSRSVPWTDPLVDVVFPTIAIASLLARHEHLTQDAIPQAQDEHAWSDVSRMEDDVREIEWALAERGADGLLYRMALERSA